MDERDTARYYEEKRGDLSLWEEKPARADVRKGGTVVFSLRVTREELQLLQQAAEQQGMPVSSFIRRAALKEATAGTSATPTALFLSALAQPADFFTFTIYSELLRTAGVTEAKTFEQLFREPITSRGALTASR